MQLNDYTNKIFAKAKKYAILDKDKYLRVSHLMYSIIIDADENHVIYALHDLEVDIDIFKEEILKIRNQNIILNNNLENEDYEPIISEEVTRIFDTEIDATWDICEIVAQLLLFDNECATIFKSYNITNRKFNKALLDLAFDVESESEEPIIDILFTNDREHSFANNKPQKKSNNDNGINFLIDLNEEVRNRKNLYFERTEKLDEIYRILNRKKKKNPLLIGGAGVGKTAFIEGIAHNVNIGNIPNFLENKKILSLNLNNLISGTMFRGDFENKMKVLLDQITKDNNILYIDEIHNIVGAGDNVMDFANILKPYLSREDISVIGSTTLEEYHKYIEKNKALSRRFQTVFINEPDIKETVKILSKVKNEYEKYHNMVCSNEIIEEIVNISDKYINFSCQPDKSIQILDDLGASINIEVSVNTTKDRLKELKVETVAMVSSGNYDDAKKIIAERTKLLKSNNKKFNSKKNITINYLHEFIKNHYNISLAEKFNHELFYSHLNHKILGQQKPLNILKNYFKLKEYILKNKNEGVLIFMGKTGIGKTETAKLIADYYYANKINRLDCANYSDKFSVTNLIGSPNGYVDSDTEPNWITYIKNNPRSVLLLDEVEKAHRDIFDIFLPIFDDGYLKMKNGDIINFKQVLIIMTSNIGSDKNIIGFDNKNSSVITDLFKFFKSELINRIDKIIRFNDINEDSAIKILENLIIKNKDLLLKLDLNINPTDHIKNINYSAFGARSIKRYLDDLIENKIDEM